jgi:Carboxypeptidase regulatory-like domain
MISHYSRRLCVCGSLNTRVSAGSNDGCARGPSLATICRIPRLAILFLLMFLATFPAAAQQTKDQKKAEAMLRTVHGLVENKDEDPVSASVVYLLNVKTQAVRTSFADEKGLYRFSGLDPNVDYEIHAEHDDLTSSTRTISSFDSRRDIEVNLKVTRKKKP